MGSGSGGISDEAKQEKEEAISDIGFLLFFLRFHPLKRWLHQSVQERLPEEGEGGGEIITRIKGETIRREGGVGLSLIKSYQGNGGDYH